MYDALIIGNDIASLVAAALLARTGVRTALISDEGLPEVHEVSGYCFDVDPLPWTGLGQGGVFSTLLDTLDIELPKGTDENDGLQVINRKHRMDFPGNGGSGVHNWRLEFPDHARHIESFFQNIPACSSPPQLVAGCSADVSRSRFSAKGFMRCLAHAGDYLIHGIDRFRREWLLRNDPDLLGMLNAPCFLLSNAHTQVLNPVLRARLLSHVLRGFMPLRARNKADLLEKIRKTLTSRGGRHINGCSLPVPSIGQSIHVSFQEDNGTQEIRASRMIASTSWRGFRKMLREDRHLSLIDRRLDAAYPACYPFTLHMGVNSRGIPEQMKPDVIVLSETTKNHLEEGVYYLHVSPLNERTCAPEGMRTLEATLFLKTPPGMLQEGCLVNIFRGMLDSLRWFLPFLPDHITYIDLERSLEISRKRQSFLNPKQAIAGGYRGIFPFLSPETPRDNIFMTGGLLMPGLGFEGEILSGINAARALIGE